jgi:hypothetical protein
VAVVILGGLFTAMAVFIPITQSVDKLTEALSQPGDSRIKIDSVTFETKSGDAFELKDIEATSNSRMIDYLLGVVVSEGK